MRPRAARVLLALMLLATAFRPTLASKLFSLSLDDVARGQAEVVDLTHALQEDTPLFPGGVPFTLEPLTKISDGYYMNTFSSGEHTGTHVDAPAHFGKGLQSVAEIPPVRLVSLGIMIDVRSRAASNPDYMLTLADLLEWEKANGKIPPRALVLLNTGWHLRWGTAERYLNKDDAGTMHFPGFAPAALGHLMKERDVNGVGTDAPSIDPGISTAQEGHKQMLEGGRFLVEDLDNLDVLPLRGFTLIVAPMKISRGSGAPARVLAIVPR